MESKYSPLGAENKELNPSNTYPKLHGFQVEENAYLVANYFF